MNRIAVFALLGATAVAFAAPVPKENDTARMVRIYGTRADPKDDARYEMRGDALRVFLPALELPPWIIRAGQEPGTPAQVAGQRWKPTPHGAARVWKEVDGDFTAVVRVSFQFRKENPETWFIHPRVAGLVAWSGDTDHAGLMRCEEYPRTGPQEAFRLMLTHPTGIRTTSGKLPHTASSAYLRLRREGKSVTSAYSRDGKE